MDVRKRDVDPETLRAKFEEAPEELTEEEVEWLIHLRELGWEEYDGYLDECYRSAGRD